MTKHPYIVLAIGLVCLVIAFFAPDIFPVRLLSAIIGFVATIVGLASINKLTAIIITVIGLIGTAIFFISIKTYLALTGDTSGMFALLVLMPCIVIGLGSYLLQRKSTS